MASPGEDLRCRTETKFQRSMSLGVHSICGATQLGPKYWQSDTRGSWPTVLHCIGVLERVLLYQIANSGCSVQPKGDRQPTQRVCAWCALTPEARSPQSGKGGRDASGRTSTPRRVATVQLQRLPCQVRLRAMHRHEAIAWAHPRFVPRKIRVKTRKRPNFNRAALGTRVALLASAFTHSRQDTTSNPLDHLKSPGLNHAPRTGPVWTGWDGTG